MKLPKTTKSTNLTYLGYKTTTSRQRSRQFMIEKRMKQDNRPKSFTIHNLDKQNHKKHKIQKDKIQL